MKKIIFPTLFTLPFSRHRLPPGGIRELLARNPEWINSYSVSLLFITASFILGIFVRGALVLSISWLFFLAVMYFSVLSRCRAIHITRSHPLAARENEVIDICYQIENRGGISLVDCLISDTFSGCRQQKWEYLLDTKIHVGRSRKVWRSVTLDNGMGTKQFGKIEVAFWDLLGIFTFKVVFEVEKSIEVMPLVNPFPHPWERAQEETPHFGLLEVEKKGDSTNFVDLREYREGDALRSVNWMVSLKTDKILVNEFDQMVDSHLSVFINNDFRANSGEGAFSTFEYSRDLALTIAQDQLEKGNIMRLITCDQFHHIGRGNDFFQFLELHLSMLKQVEVDATNINHSIIRFFELVPIGGTLVYISSLHHQSYLQHDMKLLKELALENRRVIVLFVNPYPYLYRLIRGEGRVTVAGLLEGAKTIYTNLEEMLFTSGVYVYQVEVDERKTFKEQLSRLGLKHLLFQESFR